MLTSAKEVIAALDGYRAVAKLTGRKYTAVHNWGVFDAFPANTYLTMTGALNDQGYQAPADLWKMSARERVE